MGKAVSFSDKSSFCRGSAPVPTLPIHAPVPTLPIHDFVGVSEMGRARGHRPYRETALGR